MGEFCPGVIGEALAAPGFHQKGLGGELGPGLYSKQQVEQPLAAGGTPGGICRRGRSLVPAPSQQLFELHDFLGLDPFLSCSILASLPKSCLTLLEI
jgi:hypothetical protein